MRWFGWATLLGLATGCGSSPAGPGNEAPFAFAFTDPAGDTVAATLNPGSAPGIDLVAVSGSLTSTELSLTLEFEGPVTPWTDGALNGLDGFVSFDVDQNPNTGFADQARNLGVDFYLDLRDNGFGRVAVVDQVKRRFVVIPATFDGTRFSVTIPRSAIALSTDTASDLTFVIDLSARDRSPVVDLAPNTGAFQITP